MGIVNLQEIVTENDEIVQETTKMGALSVISVPHESTSVFTIFVVEVQHVVFSRDGILDTTQNETHFWQFRDIGAIRGDITNFSQHGVVKPRGSGQCRGSSIDNSSQGILHGQHFPVNHDSVKLDTVVIFTGQRMILDVTSVISVVDATEEEFAPFGVVLSREVERETRVRHQFLFIGIDEPGFHIVGGKTLESKSQQSIERSFPFSGSIRHQSKNLVLYLNTTQFGVVLSQASGDLSRTVPDIDGSVQVFESSGIVSVKLSMARASFGGAVSTVNPQVATSGIEDNLQGLRRRSHVDNTVISLIFPV
mmetsp:Transcript_46298/g.53356  ORF Transcript_46298/g.53356 Transcript_46298/m.53356 type:complete len:308 (-) Transcript_46298:240-1163(-)